MTKIYFDHSATTPLDKKVLEAMMPYLTTKYGNPSSIHGFGREAMSGVDQARDQVAEFLACDPNEVIFTSGATESDNLVIRGVIKALPEKIKKPHIITTAIEHKAILEPCLELEKQGIEVTYLPVNSKGVINLQDLKEKIKDTTVLVSIMYVNSETGAIQPVREAGKVIQKINQQRYKEWQKWGAKQRLPKPRTIYFHTDATQAANFLACQVDNLKVDFLSLSGHKIYGPKGVGALYVRKGSLLKPIQTGGSQEKALRSGTLHTPGIVGLGKAVSLLTSDKQVKTNDKLAKLRDKLVKEIQTQIPDTILTTDRTQATPAHAHFLFPGAEGEAILISLDLEGIAVSTGSACAAKDLHPSHVLKAMGIKPEQANCAIRFSLGQYNTEADIKKLMKILPSVIERIRNMNPIYKK